MDIIESIRIGVRRRVAGNIIEPSAYQRQWMDDAPDDVDVYIRETVMESSREAISQATHKVIALVQFDIFVRRGAYPNPLAIASDYADRIVQEFNPGSTETIRITLDDGNDGIVQNHPYQEAPSQEEEWYHLPVLFSVGVYL